jgi:hypothetical protein
VDVDRQTDGRQGQLGVLGEVVSDHGEPLVVVLVDVPHSLVGTAGPGARVRAKVLLSHREGAFFLGGQALVRDASPGGGRFMSAVVCPR